jgi:SagB-type dehydrogenase family enzyme
MKPRITQFLAEKDRNPEQVWELFHENSKINRHQRFFGNDYVVDVMQDHRDALDYEAMPEERLHFPSGLVDPAMVSAIEQRSTHYDWDDTRLTREQLSALLELSCGLNASEAFDPQLRVRPRRNCPSGGAMHPLEVFVSVRNVDGMAPGLYHFNPHRCSLNRLREGDQSVEISQAFVQNQIIQGAACVWMITAIFERTVFKYGNRGYRFALLEAGHMAQISNSLATSLGVHCHNIGGFFDHEIDQYLGIDGLNHSTVYCLAFGMPA